MKTSEREMLEYAAKACRINLNPGCLNNNTPHVYIKNGLWWNPLINSADCAAMCAKLEVETAWKRDSVVCSTDRFMVAGFFKDHNHDREAAWQYAATKVAAKVGGMK